MPTIGAKRPFPREWFSIQDLIDPLSIQARDDVAGDLELYFLRSDVSYTVERGVLPSDLRGTIPCGIGEFEVKERTTQYVPYGLSTNPTERQYTQREIMESILTSGATRNLNIPDAAIKQRCFMLDLPVELQSNPFFDGWERLCVREMACSHFTQWLKGTINLTLKSPAKIVRDDLMTELHIRKREIPMKRMRSTLQLHSVVGLSGGKVVGWYDLQNQRTHENASEPLAEALCMNKFFRDVAEPRQYGMDGIDQLRLYKLREHGHLVALKLGPEWNA
jgi:hypothetical protein